MASAPPTSPVRANRAAAQLTADGADIAAGIDGRLISLQLTESREDGADKLEVVLDNADGRIAPLRKGAVLGLKLGWLQGSEVTTGLVDKGRFTVDEVEKSGPPNIVTIRARSADLTGTYRKRRDAVHKQTTLGALIGKIAKANGLTAKVHPSLSGKTIDLIEQAGRSDMAFARDLGKRFDATATVKDKHLVFTPIGRGEGAGGTALPPLALTLRDGGRWRFTTAARGEYDGAEAQWHDPAAARRRTAKVGGGSNPKKLKRVYGSEEQAKAAAAAEQQRQARGQHTFEYDLALGDPAIIPERPVTLTGWDSEIDAIRWIVKEATHSFSPNEGLNTRLSLESRG